MGKLPFIEKKQKATQATKGYWQLSQLSRLKTPQPTQSTLYLLTVTSSGKLRQYLHLTAAQKRWELIIISHRPKGPT